ncbi:MAG TPA: site-2 protease family protein [Vicinamibacterales bacterium]|nr:site-2 protease family protein [Vicinamibacterales bacterium]
MEGQLLTGFLWFVAFLFSTTVHEAMHALAAYRGGDATAYHGGQVSLSPVPHIRREPIGMLVVPLLTALTQGWSIGWASTPYNPRWAAAFPNRAAIMAAAGPAGNLALAAVALVLLRVGLGAGWFTAPQTVTFDALVAGAGGEPSFAGMLLSIFLVLNVLLAAFNLIPLPPLDGASVIGLFLPPTASRRMRELSGTPMFQVAGLLIAWQIFPAIVRPLFTLLLGFVHPQLSYG